MTVAGFLLLEVEKVAIEDPLPFSGPMTSQPQKAVILQGCLESRGRETEVIRRRRPVARTRLRPIDDERIDTCDAAVARLIKADARRSDSSQPSQALWARHVTLMPRPRQGVTVLIHPHPLD